MSNASKIFKIETHHGQDYVSVADAKDIMGVKSAKDLRALGSATLTIQGRTLWSVKWLISKARTVRYSQVYAPDLKWIQKYVEGEEKAAKKVPHYPVARARRSSHKGRNTLQFLDELRELMPPPKRVPGKKVDWEAVEDAVGISYPCSFKDFIGVYGMLRWFDWLQPLSVSSNRSPNAFRKQLEETCRAYLAGDVVDRKTRRQLLVPKIGTAGAWLPFLEGNNGDVYCWNTTGTSEEWDVLHVVNLQVTVLPPMSLAEMLSDWLKGGRKMEAVWGSVEAFREHSESRLSMLR